MKTSATTGMACATFLAFLSGVTYAQNADWHFVEFDLPSGQSFISQTTEMVAPTLPGAGTYYLWPSLNPSDNSGVYQNVLDGRSGSWELGSGWCCSNPSLPWGSSIGVGNGNTVAISNIQQSDGSWTSTITDLQGGASATNNFAIGSKTFISASYAIELYGVTWTFGPLVFNNIVMKTVGGTDASWCNTTPWNYEGRTEFTISGVSSTVQENGVTCTIDQLVLTSPAPGTA